MYAIETEASDVLGDVLEAEEVGLLAVLAEQRRDVPLLRVQLPTESTVGEAHHAVGVWVAACSQAGATRAALRCHAEGLLKPYPS